MSRLMMFVIFMVCLGTVVGGVTNIVQSIRINALEEQMDQVLQQGSE